ncbi:MAG: CoA transferase, partial [Chloroflexi bacterium]|nr:CoA transferase [Chloroflexota bacterium]
ASPLSGITVIEVSEGVAGAFCGRMLAGFGANVIKVERPPNGDWTRWAEPQLEGLQPAEAGALYLFNNMGKKSVTLDWTEVEGMAALRNLISNADVLIDDWTFQTRQSLGLHQGELEKLNDSLINLSITPFGLDGPYSEWLSTPLVSLALGGYLYLSGSETREPLMLPGHQSQYLAALQGYAGIMLSLRARSETGTGQAVEISEMESLTSLHQFTIVSHTYDGVVRRRAGVRLAVGRSLGGYAMTTLPCKDGYITFAASAPQQREHLCVMIGREDLLEDPTFGKPPRHKESADEFDVILTDWIKDKTRQEIVELAAGVWSVPTSPVLSIKEIVQDTQYVARGLFQEVEHPQGGTLTFPNVPFHMSKTSPRFTRAPSLGEHNQDVFKKEASRRTPRKTKAREPRKSLLDGVRVLDLTRVWAGPLAVRFLADFGAHVIKLSDPRTPVDRMVGTNNKLNRNKANLAIRLDTPEGRSAFLELVSISDIVIESFRPRVMRNFDLGYDVLRKVRPDLIMCAMSGYGSTGENAEFPAYGSSVESVTGLTSLMGYEGDSPMPSGIAFPDPSAALNSVAAMLTALHHRAKTGEGQFIDMALAEGLVCQIGEFVGASEHNGSQPERHGNSHYKWAPQGVYQALGDDQWIAISVTTEEQWSSFCQVMGRPGLASDEKFSSESARKANEQVLNQLISEWMKDNDAIELMRDLQSKGVPAGAAYKNIDLLSDPHLREREFFVELDESDIGPKIYPGQAIRTAGLNRQNWTASDRLGERNLYLLNELLGLASSITSDMEQKGVIGSYLDF